VFLPSDITAGAASVLVLGTFVVLDPNIVFAVRKDKAMISFQIFVSGKETPSGGFDAE
jgi:hypothetical protein